MQDFKVSVVIPVYNAEKYIKTAVDSVLIQPEVGEVILVEDKSPDSSLKVCTELAQADKRVQLCQHPDKQNHGASASRNLGIEKARFDYISFLDADDYYLPARFKKDKEVFEKSPSVDGVYNALGTDYYEHVENAMIKKGFVTTITKNLKPEELFEALLDTRYGWIHSDAVTVRKRVFKKVGMFDTKFPIGEDIDLWIRAAAMCILVGGQTKEPVAMRGVHSQNTINDAKRVDTFRPKIYAKLLRWAVENKLPADKKRLLWKYYYRTNVDHVPRNLTQRFRDAAAELFKHPYLLGYGQYYKSLPFITRHIK